MNNPQAVTVTEMEIRYVNAGDSLTEISRIYEKSWKYAYRGIIPQDYLDAIPTGRWADGITRDGMQSLVMTEHGRIIGTASFCRSRWAQYPDFGEIVSIYLLPAYMGKGYGGYLLKRCAEELKQRGYDSILLWCLEDNRHARTFYEKNGFICSDVYMKGEIGGKLLREVMYMYHTNA